MEWRRVLNQNGSIVCIVPDKKDTRDVFDHKRPDTTLEHVIQDYQHNTGEDDVTHLPEITALHDLTRDPLAGSMENFKIRSQYNRYYRYLHHHVFTAELLRAMFVWCNFTVCTVDTSRRGNIIVVGTKKDNS
jgi:hypothetical protein